MAQPQHEVTIGKCACGHSRAAHNRAQLGGCGFCGCLQFQLDDVVREVPIDRPKRAVREYKDLVPPGSDKK